MVVHCAHMAHTHGSNVLIEIVAVYFAIAAFTEASKCVASKAFRAFVRGPIERPLQSN